MRVVPPTDAVVTKLAPGLAGQAPGKLTLLAFTVPPPPAFVPVSGTPPAGTPALLVLFHSPLRVELYVGAPGALPGVPSLVVNERSLSFLEHRRSKEGSGEGSASAVAEDAVHGGRKLLHWGEDGKAVYEEDGEGKEGEEGAAPSHTPVPPSDAGSLWEETFSSHRDSKPNGPTALGFDVTFPRAAHVYGIPEHATSHSLKPTDGSSTNKEFDQPYRLYNLDVFEYELDNPMSLYGSIPFLLGHGPDGSTAGVYWNNPTETYVDVAKRTPADAAHGKGAKAGGAGADAGVATRWISESGVFDLTLVPGPTGHAAVAQYTSLTGTQALPPLFALGYHQCRWNYRDEADVFAVDAAFESHAFPYDVLWLDIEHTDGKRYFTWDKTLFPSPAAMQNKLAARGHRMVTIIDPHIKKDSEFHVHAEATDKKLYVRKADGGEYEGWCWPGASGYLDFTSSVVREWWAGLFALDKYVGSTLSLFTWNDMNEPSVFNGPEVSMHKDALSLSGVEHREWHNLYGFYQQMASAVGLTARAPSGAPPPRPFVLSRSFFAGSQRYGAIWTGDNDATWAHLQQAAPMLLTIGVTGLTFSGADVGGFFHNPSTELLLRWYGAGSFQPFFRAHAHIDTARREPWLFGEETLGRLRDIVRTRYTYLPLWYTLFAEAAATGAPTMRPLWLEFPGDDAVASTDDAWMVGSALLVKPVVEAGATTVTVYFPGAGPWFDAASGVVVHSGGPGSATLPAPVPFTPVFVQGGAIIPRQMRPRRSSAQMLGDPFTLVVAPSAAGTAAGALYLDDTVSTDATTKGLFRLRSFTYGPGGAPRTSVLRSVLAKGSKLHNPQNVVERVVVLGVASAPSSVTVGDDAGAGRAGESVYDATTQTLTIRKPGVKAAYDWTITIVW